MDRRPRRWRLPLAVRIGAVPALVALAGGLTFGLISQSDATPASHGASIRLSSPRPPATSMPVFSDRSADLDATISVKSLQDCVPGHCDPVNGTVRVWIHMDGKPAGNHFSAEVSDPGGFGGSSVTIRIPGSELSSPGFGSIVFDFSSPGFGYVSDIERLKVRDKYSGRFNLSQSADTSLPGEKVDFTATYAGGDAVPDTPTGTLELSAGNGTEVKPVPGGRISVTGKTFTFSTTKLPKGTKFVRWTYSGDGRFDADNESSRTLTHTVKDGVETQTTLTVNPTTMPWGTNAHFKIKVTARSGTAVPTGDFEVQLAGGSSFVGHLNANGEREDDSPVGPPGEYPVLARYLPSGNFAPSQSTPVTVTVTKAGSTTTVTATPDAVRPGKPVTLSAKVTPDASLPDGRVAFSDGAVELGSCELDKGRCEITTDKLAPGTRTVTAAFDGNRNLNASQGSVAVRVSEASTTKLTATPVSVTVGSPVALSAQVSGGAPAGGKVTFLDGTLEIDKSDVDKDGTAAVSTAALAVGTHELTARFEGTDALDRSTSEKVSVRVNAATTPGQGGGGSQNGGTPGGSGDSGGSTPQPKNLASTGADIGAPLRGGAVLVILGAVAVTLGRKRRRARSSR